MRTRRDQLAVGRVTLHGYRNLASGRLRTSVTLSRGLGILGATESGDPLASRRDADGTFTTVNAWADWTSNLGGNFSLRLAAQGQLASQPLLISEEAGLGGTNFLRGYDWGERTGDEGAMGMAELRYSLKKPFDLLKQAQLYVFVDGGTVSNHEVGFGGGSLSSAGGGMRLDITSRLGLTFEVAVPLTGPRYDTGDLMPNSIATCADHSRRVAVLCQNHPSSTSRQEMPDRWLESRLSANWQQFIDGNQNPTDECASR